MNNFNFNIHNVKPFSDEIIKKNEEVRQKKTCIERNFKELMKDPDFKLDYSITKEYYDIIDNYVRNEIRRIDEYYTLQDIRIYMRTKFNSFDFANLLHFCISEWRGKKIHSRLEIIDYLESIIETMEKQQDFMYKNISYNFPNMSREEVHKRLIILRNKLTEMSDYEIDLYVKNNIEFTQFL